MAGWGERQWSMKEQLESQGKRTRGVQLNTVKGCKVGGGIMSKNESRAEHKGSEKTERREEGVSARERESCLYTCKKR